MQPYYERGGITVYHGDNREVLKAIEPGTISAVITDPPYGLGKEPDMVEVLTHWLAGDDYHATGGGFMGRSWDAFVPGPATWKLIAATMKPGAHLAAFSGTRTYDLMGMAIRLAGLQYRETAAWIFGSGFPKSLDVSKAIDKARKEDEAPRVAVATYLRDALSASGKSRTEIDAHFGTANVSQYWFSPHRNAQVPPVDKWQWLRDFLGIQDSALDAEVWRLNGRKGKPGDNWDKREVIGKGKSGIGTAFDHENGTWAQGSAEAFDITAPATDAAREWQGWGTALKPAYEPIILARRSLSGTVAATVLAHGTGALNIDACRIPGQPRATGTTRPIDAVSGEHGRYGIDSRMDRQRDYDANLPTGRWPANVLLDETAAAQLDQMSGERKSSLATGPRGTRPRGMGEVGERRGDPMPNGPTYGDTGGASRFFPVLPIDDPDTLRFLYTPKASRRERNAGLDGLPKRDSMKWSGGSEKMQGLAGKYPDGSSRPPQHQQNSHPTVKPLALMRWLLTLVTPPGGIVLDPFAGSGTTGVAAAQLGLSCVLIEQEAEYLPIIAGRIDHALDARAGAELPLFAGVAD